jgi:hypothetical protein
MYQPVDRVQAWALSAAGARWRGLSGALLWCWCSAPGRVQRADSKQGCA